MSLGNWKALLVLAALLQIQQCVSFAPSTCRSAAGAVKEQQQKIFTDINQKVKRQVKCAPRFMSDTDPEAETGTEIPTFLPSAVGVDYIPLATMLSLGDFLGADQFTRDNLIRIAGPDATKRAFVYWTEADKLSETDLCTMERLWLQFSDGNFGYSVQKRVWDVEQGNFDNFIRRIGWTKVENGSERKLKWFGQNEFIYTVDKAPKGHLPLTSALRGTQLMKSLMRHPVWVKYDWKNYKDLKWKP